MNWNKIALFLLFAFGISWLSAAVIYFTGMTYGTGLSMFIVACFYMPAPALSAFIVQKYVYKEPFTWGGHSLVTGMTGVAGFITISLVGIAIFLFDRRFVKEYRSLS